MSEVSIGTVVIEDNATVESSRRSDQACWTEGLQQRRRPLLPQLGMRIKIEHDKKCLYDLDHQAVDWLLEFRDEGTSTFADAVTEAAIDRFEFYLQSYEVPVDRENNGVLLADAKLAALSCSISALTKTEPIRLPGGRGSTRTKRSRRRRIRRW